MHGACMFVACLLAKCTEGSLVVRVRLRAGERVGIDNILRSYYILLILKYQAI